MICGPQGTSERSLSDQEIIDRYGSIENYKFKVILPKHERLLSIAWNKNEPVSERQQAIVEL